jgi:putative tributyrin esterase
MPRLSNLLPAFLARRRSASSLMQTIELRSEALGRPATYALLPAPELPGVDPQQLPAVLLLHGMGGNHLELDRHGLSPVFHASMLAGTLPPLHIIAPDGKRGFYLNWHDGSNRWEDHIVQEVLPHAESQLSLGQLQRERLQVAGCSMGGIGALMIGLRHPQRFGAVASLSGPIMNEAQSHHFVSKSWISKIAPLNRIFGQISDRAFFESHNPYCIVDQRAPELGQRLFVAAASGDREQIRGTAEQFHHHLELRGVAHHWELFEGNHNWVSWGPILQRAFSHGLGDSPQTSLPPAATRITP